MVCLGFKPGAAGWQAKTKPWSYGGTPYGYILFKAQKLQFNLKPTRRASYHDPSLQNVLKLNHSLYLSLSKRRFPSFKIKIDGGERQHSIQQLFYHFNNVDFFALDARHIASRCRHNSYFIFFNSIRDSRKEFNLQLML